MSGGPILLDQHRELIRASAIADEVARERGYFSATKPIDLGRLGFGERQRNVPALVLPVHGVAGTVDNYQARPDSPRIGERGKPVKYETPAKSRMALDVPPRARPQLGDPRRALFITEGVRKADSAVSHDLCCIDLLGVDNWRGTNDDGGKTALADWEYIALNERATYIVFDSDVMTKAEVYRALVRFRGFLQQRGAEVRLIYLPAEAGEAKVGLDDFLAAGHGPDALLALAEATLRPAPDADEPPHPYRAQGGGLVHLKQTREGPVVAPLTTFEARIVGDVVEDDGAEQLRALEIVGQLGARRRGMTLPAARFAGMDWPLDLLGPGAVITPGMGNRDHARAAIQLLSGDVPERVVYTHTGWREHDGRPVYLHAGGALGVAGPVTGVEVRLPGDLGRYALPDPPAGEALVAAVRASLDSLIVAPLSVTIPLLAGVYRAPLGDLDFALWLAGPTGAGKSELAALMQQHYGPALDARHLPGSWTSTGNALEGLSFVLKDSLFTIDDFAPAGNTADVQRLHRDAERVLRAQGNQAGRQRMTASATLRPARPPRGLVLGTGEDVPRGQSARARALVLELGPGDLDWGRLTTRQGAAAAGRYAGALAGYLRWLAGDLAGRRAWLRAEVLRLRAEAATSAAHRRTPGIVAELAAGWRCFLDFAVEAGALGADEAARAWARGWRELGRAAQAQARHQAAQEPARRFLELLGSAIAGGGAHIAGLDDAEPEEPARWGWRPHIGGGDFPREEWRPQGARVGWTDGAALYLDRDGALAAVQRLGRDTGDALAVTPSTLAKRLHERGLLGSVDEVRQTLTVRRTIAGRQRAVLHLHSVVLSPSTEPDKPDNAAAAGRPLSGFAPSNVGFPEAPDSEPDNGKACHGGENGVNVGFVGSARGGDTAGGETGPRDVG